MAELRLAAPCSCQQFGIQIRHQRFSKTFPQFWIAQSSGRTPPLREDDPARLECDGQLLAAHFFTPPSLSLDSEFRKAQIRMPYAHADRLKFAPRDKTRPRTLPDRFHSAARRRDYRVRHISHRAGCCHQHAASLALSERMGHWHGHYAAGVLCFC